MAIVTNLPRPPITLHNSPTMSTTCPTHQSLHIYTMATTCPTHLGHSHSLIGVQVQTLLVLSQEAVKILEPSGYQQERMGAPCVCCAFTLAWPPLLSSQQIWSGRV